MIFLIMNLDANDPNIKGKNVVNKSFWAMKKI